MCFYENVQEWGGGQYCSLYIAIFANLEMLQNLYSFCQINLYLGADQLMGILKGVQIGAFEIGVGDQNL